MVAIVATAWAFRRSVAGFWRARAAARSLEVLDVLPLGGKRQLTVVRCYDRTFVLGLGERDVSLVAEIDPASTDAPGPESSPDFDDLIERAHQRLRREPIATSRGTRNGVRKPFSEVVA